MELEGHPSLLIDMMQGANTVSFSPGANIVQTRSRMGSIEKMESFGMNSNGWSHYFMKIKGIERMKRELEQGEEIPYSICL